VSLYKRGNVWWYKFQWQGKPIRESTKQRNDKIARQMEAAHRTSLAKGEVGIREKKRVLTLAEFSKGRFEPWVESTSTEKTWSGFYRVGLLAINNYAPLANLPLDSITGESISGFASHQQARGLQVSSVNSSLRILRRLLRVAMEWGELHTMPKSKCYLANVTESGCYNPKKKRDTLPQEANCCPIAPQCWWIQVCARKNAIAYAGKP